MSAPFAMGVQRKGALSVATLGHWPAMRLALSSLSGRACT